jgi:hypothetical protein
LLVVRRAVEHSATGWGVLHQARDDWFAHGSDSAVARRDKRPSRLPTSGEDVKRRGGDCGEGLTWTVVLVLAKIYEIHIRGRLPEGVLDEFEYLTVVDVPTETVLTGTLPDQSSLFGVMARLQNLGLEILELRVSDL